MENEQSKEAMAEATEAASLEGSVPETRAAAAEKYENFIGRDAESPHLPYISSDDEGVKIASDYPVMGADHPDIVPHKDKKKLILVIGAVLLLLSAAVYGASHFLGERSDVTDAPAVVQDPIIAKTVQAMRGIGSYSFDGKMDFRRTLTSEGTAYGMDYDIAYKGVVEKETDDGPAVYSALTYGTSRSVGDRKRNTSVGVQSVLIGGKKYIKLDGIDIAGVGETSTAAVLESELGGFSGSWYAVSDNDYESFYSGIRDYTFLPMELDVFDVDNVSDLITIFDYDLLSSPQMLGEEKVNEADTVHYGVSVDPDGVVSLLASLMEKSGDSEENADFKEFAARLKNDPEESSKFKEVIAHVMQNIDIELWIGKDDNLIHKFKIGGKFDESAIESFYAKLESVYGESYADSGSTEGVGLSFDIEYTLSDFGSSKVREVQEAKDFSEIMSRISSINPAAVAAPATSDTDTDADDLTDDQEKLFGSDPNKPDTDGDGYKDGEEVKNGYDPIVPGSARLDYSKLQANK